MKVDIREKKMNPHLQRKELKGTVEHKDEATPSIESLKKFMSKELSVKEDNIIVDKIFTLPGQQKSKFWAKELEVEGREEEGGQEFECEKCGDTFDSKRGLSSHEAQAHQGEDYDEVVSGTISEAKEEIEEMEDPDYERLLEAEKDNKDRKGMKAFLEGKTGD